MLGLAAIAICVAYYGLLFAGEALGQHGTLPALAAAWLPNVVFVGGSATLLILAGHRSGTIPAEG